jgi:hypothetical protein
MYLVVNIGCIECGVSSRLVGVFSTQKRAQDVAAGCAAKYGWREGGQNAFEVFRLGDLDAVDPEYDLAPTEDRAGDIA